MGLALLFLSLLVLPLAGLAPSAPPGPVGVGVHGAASAQAAPLDPYVATWSSSGSDLLPVANTSYTLYEGDPPFPLVFGGNYTCGLFCNETLAYLSAQGAENWYDISPAHSPPPRADASLSWDPLLGGALLFGGLGPMGALNDTWLYARATGWTELTPRQSPPELYDAAMTYDPVLQAMVLFGGEGPAGPYGNTWTFNGTDWAQLPAASAPSARAGASLLYDEPTGQLVLFGGRGPSGFDADTWTLRGTTWRELAMASGPSARANAVLVGTGDGSPLLYGGVGPQGALNDSWFLVNGSWVAVSYAGGVGPPPLIGTALVRNPVLGANYFVLLGGFGSSSPLAPSWDLYAPFGGVPNGTRPLTASLTTSGSQGTAPYSVTFTVAVAGGEAPYLVSWDFGDGSTAGGSLSEIHTYTRAGSYTVLVSVTDALGVRAETSTVIVVHAPAPPSVLDILGGPPVWAALVIVGGVSVWGIDGALSEALRGRRLNRQVGSPPSRLARTATAVGQFARQPRPGVLAWELRRIWWTRTERARSRWTTSPALTWLARRLIVAIPQVLTGVTLLYFLTEVLPVTSSISTLPGPVPFLTGLGSFTQDLFTGTWGTVMIGSGRAFPATELIRYYLPYSLELAFPALLLTALISYPLGLYSGWQQGRSVDNTTRLFVAFAAFFPLLILALYFVDFLYVPFLHTFGDVPFGSLPSVTWFDQHYGGVPAWVGYNLQTQPTGFPVIDAAIHGAWDVEVLLWVKIAVQASIIGLAYSALYLRYARLAATGSRDELSVLASRSRGTSERKLLWRETSRRVLPVYVFTFGNTFALFILVQSLVEWYFEDIGVGSFLVQSALVPAAPSAAPPMLAVLAFLVLLLILAVNIVADAVSRKLDPRVGWTSRRDR